MRCTSPVSRHFKPRPAPCLIAALAPLPTARSVKHSFLLCEMRLEKARERVLNEALADPRVGRGGSGSTRRYTPALIADSTFAGQRASASPSSRGRSPPIGRPSAENLKRGTPPSAAVERRERRSVAATAAASSMRSSSGPKVYANGQSPYDSKAGSMWSSKPVLLRPAMLDVGLSTRRALTPYQKRAAAERRKKRANRGASQDAKLLRASRSFDAAPAYVAAPMEATCIADSPAAAQLRARMNYAERERELLLSGVKRETYVKVDAVGGSGASSPSSERRVAHPLEKLQAEARRRADLRSERRRHRAFAAERQGTPLSPWERSGSRGRSPLTRDRRPLFPSPASRGDGSTRPPGSVTLSFQRAVSPGHGSRPGSPGARARGGTRLGTPPPHTLSLGNALLQSGGADFMVDSLRGSSRGGSRGSSRGGSRSPSRSWSPSRANHLRLASRESYRIPPSREGGTRPGASPALPLPRVRSGSPTRDVIDVMARALSPSPRAHDAEEELGMFGVYEGARADQVEEDARQGKQRTIGVPEMAEWVDPWKESLRGRASVL